MTSGGCLKALVKPLTGLCAAFLFLAAVALPIVGRATTAAAIQAPPIVPPAPTPGPPPPGPIAPLAVQVGPVAPCSLVRLSLSGNVETADWEILYAPNILFDVDYALLNADGTSAVFAGPAGAYRVTAWCVSGGRIAHASAAVTIPPCGPPTPTPNPPTPTPAPTPGPAPPTPTPTPVPLSGKFWAVAVFDFNGLASLPNGQRLIFQSTTIGPAVSAMGGTFLKYDQADASQQSAAWMIAAKKAGVPALVIVDQGGTVHSAAALPADEASVLTALKTAMGKR